MGFTFNISLSVLNHLGRNLYRNFVTVIGEAISNSWDADAKNVWIEIDRDKRSMLIYDDGIGMSAEDFQDKFLKIGYSKRKDGESKTPIGRPFIGRKGIGKLALLSCAKKIHIASKACGQDIIGGQIDNSGLDEAILDDISPNEYVLEEPDRKAIEKLKDLEHGTSIFFESLNDGVINTLEYLQKIIALDFRFSLIDPTFKIFLNNEPITLNALADLAKSTQFVWQINEPDDEYLLKKISVEGNENIKNYTTKQSELGIFGFIATVAKPSNLKITGTKEKVTIDLFVNGRLREKNFLKHFPTTRIVENYMYGQIHYDKLDYDADRFTTSRESVISDDPLFIEFLEELEKIVRAIIEEWDELRRELGNDGDPDNEALSPKQRKAEELYNEAAKDYVDDKPSKKVKEWSEKLRKEAVFNVPSYTECFIAENLLREYITDRSLPLKQKAKAEVNERRKAEAASKGAVNISFDIRESNEDLNYLSMDYLANCIDIPASQTNNPTLTRDAKSYKPVRDAVAHTSLITCIAKEHLNTVFENIKARLKTLLNEINS